MSAIETNHATWAASRKVKPTPEICACCDRTLVMIEANPAIGPVCINFECAAVGGDQTANLASTPHACGHCHACGEAIEDGVCPTWGCGRWDVAEAGEDNPYHGPCPIELGQ